jgi:ammonia channel protein AmtB
MALLKQCISFGLLIIKGAAFGFRVDFGHFKQLALVVMRQFQNRHLYELQELWFCVWWYASSDCSYISFICVAAICRSRNIFDGIFAVQHVPLVSAAPIVDPRDRAWNMMLRLLSLIMHNLTEHWHWQKDPSNRWNEVNVEFARCRSPLTTVSIGISVVIDIWLCWL